MFLRERVSLPVVFYGLYVVFLDLSFRRASEALRPFADRSHVAVWSWVQALPGFRRLLTARCRVSIFLADEAAVMVRGFMASILYQK